MSVKSLYLNKGSHKRLRSGHTWVFSNELDTRRAPLKDCQPGEQVAVHWPDGRFAGMGYVNPASLIAVRLYAREKDQALDRSLLVHRLNIALSLRKRLFEQPFYRLVYGDSDALSGLIVDRYGEYLVVQVTTAGMEVIRDEIVQALLKVIQPAGIVWRNDSPMRDLEGLDRYTAVAEGEVPAQVEVWESGRRFVIDPLEGQKTGWFYDQTANRERFERYVAGGRILDLFSYVGAWSRCALAAGATAVTMVDTSAPALRLAAQGFEDDPDINLDQVDIELIQDNAFEVLKELANDKARFDMVVVDPPALIKRKKDAAQGLSAYRRINELAMRVLSRDGILVSCSCSHHLHEGALPELIHAAARHIDARVQLLETLQQGPDHPVHPAMPETRYLKGVIARVLRG